MPAIVPAIRLGKLLFASALVVSCMGGCASTTTATVEGTVHSGDSAFRFQSCDATARVEIVLTRN